MYTSESRGSDEAGEGSYKVCTFQAVRTYCATLYACRASFLCTGLGDTIFTSNCAVLFTYSDVRDFFFRYKPLDHQMCGFSIFWKT